MTVVDGALRVRFGEVEARGDRADPGGPGPYDAAVAGPDPALVWPRTFPATEREMVTEGLGYATYAAADLRAARPGMTLPELLAAGALTLTPLVYEDFLPRSAAGIFRSNLTSGGGRDDRGESAPRDAAWLSGALAAEIADPFALYESDRARPR